MKKKISKRKRVLFIVLGSILGVIAVLVLAISIIASKNVKAMNQCVDEFMEELQENYTLTPRDVGEYRDLTVKGFMKFDVEQYKIEDIGNLSVMRVNIGVMQMATMVITPTEKNLPLFSMDYMYMLTNRTCYLEFYDLVAEQDDAYRQLLEDLTEAHNKYESLSDAEVSEAWYSSLLTVGAYKNGKMRDDAALKDLMLDTLKVYEHHADQLPILTNEKKQEKIKITMEYTDGLITHGGISTDVFKDSLGEEKTKHFFNTVFFGTLAE